MSQRSWIPSLSENINRSASGYGIDINDESGVIEHIADKFANGAFSTLSHLFENGLNTVFTELAQTSGIGEAIGGAFAAQAKLTLFNGLKEFAKEQTKAWDKVDQAAYEYGKKLGMSSTQVQNLRRDILSLSETSVRFGAHYGKTLEDVIKLQGTLNSAISKSISYTNQQIEDLSALSAVVGDEMAVKLTSSLDKFGLSVSASSKMMANIYNDSLKKGISLEAYSKNVVDNLHLAQQYAFKDGVKGLKSMAELSAKVHLDMQQVFRLADKVSTVQGAVEMSSQLQVLGGAFASFADPMALLSGSLTDIESLNERLVNLVGQYGRLDSNTKEFNISNFDKVRLRSAAQAMGVDYGELIKSANRQAQRKEIEAQMTGNIPEEFRELLMNTAQFENGRAGIRGADGTFKTLSQLNGADLKLLAQNSMSDSENIRDIAKMMRGALQMEEGIEKEKENRHASQYAERSEDIKGIRENLAENTAALQALVKLEVASKVFSSVISPMLGLVGKVGAPIKLFGKLFGFANGGVVRTHSDGDLITNGSVGKEYILNSAQNGEFIVNKESTSRYLPILRAINNDRNGNLRVRTHSDGGMTSNFLGMGMMSTLPAIMMMSRIGMMSNNIRQGNPLFYDSSTMNPMMAMFGNNANTQQATKNFATSIGKGVSEHPKIMQVRADILKQEARLKELKMQMNNPNATSRQMRAWTREMEGLNKNLASNNALLDKNISKYGTRQPSAHWVAKRDALLAQKQRGANIKAGMLSGITGGLMGGFIGYTQASAKYSADGTDIMDAGKAQGGKIGAAAGAAITTGLLSCIPFIGPAIGPILGPAVGGAIGSAIGENVGKINIRDSYRTYSSLQNSIASAEGRNKFYGISASKYSSKELKTLANALNDGNISEGEIHDNLIKKLESTGNGNIIAKKYHNGTSSVSTGYFDERGQQLAILRRGEAVLSEEENKKWESWKKGEIKVRDTSGSKIVNSQQGGHITNTAKVEDININVGGSLKFDGSDKKFDIDKELVKNPTFITELTTRIVKQMNKDANFSLNVRALNGRNRFDK